MAVLVLNLDQKEEVVTGASTDILLGVANAQLSPTTYSHSI